MRAGVLLADRFEIDRKIASGGMGTVFRANDRFSGRVVALKVLTDVAGGERERFVREVRVLSDLKHPAIVRYVAHGETQEHEPWLAMEWLDGETLGARLAREPMSVEETILLGGRIADALAAAHARGIVHRDVKPGNIILVDRDPAAAKLIDFGVVRLSERDGARTRTGLMVGTPQYMSPEQARGTGHVDARSDVFALGCVMFRCLTGRAPFAAEDFLTVLARLLLEPAPRVSSACANAPPELDELVARMLSKEPAGRPADGAAVSSELALLREATVRDRPPARSVPDHEPLTDTEQSLLSVVLAHATADSEPPNVEDIVTRYGARLEHFVDGTMLVVLDGRGTATDSAAAAAKCALALRDRLHDAAVVLATGRAVVSRSATVGEVIERAVRLLRSTDIAPVSVRRAGGSTIRIDEATAGLLDRRFTLRSGGPDAGIELLGVRGTEQTGRTILGKPTSFVGRDRELSVLLGLFDECVSEPVARAALVTAPAGMGKSRLRYELLRRLAQRGDPYTLLMGRGDALRVGSPFALIAPAVRATAGVLEGEPTVVQKEKLRERVAQSVEAAEQRRITEFLGEIVGMPFSDEDSIQLRSARRDALLMADQTRRAWEDFLAAECARQPVLVVLEDLHWGDVPSVLCIDSALRRLASAPFMVVAFARPEVADAFPGLWREHAVQPVPLPALGKRAGVQLVREVLGDKCDAAMVERIVERASGNAFYLEELIRAFAEGKGDGLPETVLAMVQARLATLESDARRALRAASLFGEAFWTGGIRALVERSVDVDDWMEVLAEREIVVARADSRFPDQKEYRFRHALLREAAYSMLTEADRAHGHALAGAWLERAGERDAALLAEHFEKGGEKARAAVWYTRASEQALEANDLDGAIARALAGARCGARGEPLGRLRLTEALAHQWRGRWEQTEACAREAMSLLRRGSRRWCVAAEQLTYGLGKIGKYDELGALVESVRCITPEEDATGAYAIALGRGSWFLVHACRFEQARSVLSRVNELASTLSNDDVGPAAQIDAIRAGHALYAEDFEACLALSQSAVARFELAGDPRAVAMQLVFMGDSYKELGVYEKAEPIFREAIATSSRMGLHTVTALAKLNLEIVLAYSGSFANAVALGREAVLAYTEYGDHRLQIGAKTYLAITLAAAGDLEGAVRVAREATETPCRSPPTSAFAHATLAMVLLQRGDAPEQALAAAQVAMGTLEDVGHLEEGEAMTCLAYAEALRATGDAEAARVAIAKARDRILSRASSLRDPSIRESFLTRVPHNARTLALAEEWGKLGSA
jgi:serine/threonine protein kinase/tetratricopeptide (TPR) repeat protein